jgi:ADP-ribosyl-[dinitrogen reductase] hydrolase
MSFVQIHNVEVTLLKIWKSYMTVSLALTVVTYITTYSTGDGVRPTCTFLITSSPCCPATMALHKQFLVHATAATKIRLSLLSVAIVDALGGPAEFRSRFSFNLITTMIPNAHFGLPPGVWTDDTSMTLCLARSLATYTSPGNDLPDIKRGGFDEVDQITTYSRWRDEGYLSAVDYCFDVGGTIRRALSIWSNRHSHETPGPSTDQQALNRIKIQLDGEYCCGNGSLMRIIPIGLAYWRNEEMAREYARRSSDVTHPNRLCAEACELWTMLVVRIMKEAIGNDGGETAGAKMFSKLDLLKEIAAFPYSHPKLKDALALPSSAPPSPNPGTTENKESEEEYYCKHHPLLLSISQSSTTTKPTSPYLTSPIPPSSTVPSTGYVLHTLLAALYAFFATNTFEEGAIMVVNMGDDADTVGAVYAGLAGCWYGSDRDRGSNEEGELFWTPKVEEWLGALVKRDLVEEVAEELVRFSEGLAVKSSSPP